jgi:endonuclease/exonuclease/phosphatase family metal-dependent hydrolase
MRLKLVSYNVHKLFDITGRKYFLSALRDVFVLMDLDFIFLQELPGIIHQNHQEKFSKDPLEHLADDIWTHYVFGKNAISGRRNHGNAILSKYPFKTYENHDLSNHRWEQRGLLLGHTDIHGKQLTLGCTHLDLTMMGRARQIKKIKKVLDHQCQENEPLLICGDFNDWDGQTSKQVQSIDLKTIPIGPTFPSFFPILPLDRIFFRNINCIKAEVLQDPTWKKLSDHLPMYAEFELI